MFSSHQETCFCRLGPSVPAQACKATNERKNAETSGPLSFLLQIPFSGQTLSFPPVHFAPESRSAATLRDLEHRGVGWGWGGMPAKQQEEKHRGAAPKIRISGPQLCTGPHKTPRAVKPGPEALRSYVLRLWLWTATGAPPTGLTQHAHVLLEGAFF